MFSCSTSTARAPGDVNEKRQDYVPVPLGIKGRVTDGQRLFQPKGKGRTDDDFLANAGISVDINGKTYLVSCMTKSLTLRCRNTQAKISTDIQVLLYFPQVY